MPAISIQRLEKVYGGSVVALHRIDLQVRDGEFLVILGPSGCGKTTTLRCVAGLEQPSGGTIYIGDRCVYSAASGIDLQPRERNIGMIFQSYALYPHMTVFDNVAFGLKVRHVPKEEIKKRVTEALGMVELTGFENRRPNRLSGGQQQRVAVARTIAAGPDVLLFDEPLSNLDPELRVSVRGHLKKVHRRIGATSLFVTHDQQEAMVLADRMAVMDGGVIAQTDHPQQVYSFPATPFVAEFTGNPKTNLIAGEVYVGDERALLVPERDPYCFIPLTEDSRAFRGRRVIFHVRPEDLEIISHPTENEGSLPIMAIMQEGAQVLVHLRFGDGSDQLIARGSFSDFAAIRRDSRVGLRFRRGNIFDPDTGRLASSFGFGGQPAAHRQYRYPSE